MLSHRHTVSLLALCGGLLVSLGVQADGWLQSRGGPARQGIRSGTANLGVPQVHWRHRLGGGLGNRALSPTLRDGKPAVWLAVGGRVELRRWDNRVLRQTPLLGLQAIAGEVDIDSDGTADVLVAYGNSAGPVLAVLDLDSEETWTAPKDLLGAQLADSLRIVDLDGDGNQDLYVGFATGSPDGRIASAFALRAGMAPRFLYSLYGADRDYAGGFFDLVGELDGSPGLEVLAQGKRHLYTFDAATGFLESTSAELGEIPYARATNRVLDVDGDGREDILAYSNQGWAAPNNRRHVSRFSWDSELGAMSLHWTREVADHQNDQISFHGDSTVDLDSDGLFETVVGLYDSASDSWTTVVLDSRDGRELAAVAGRFEATVPVAQAGVSLIATIDEPQLRFYEFRRASGLSILASHSNLELPGCHATRESLRDHDSTSVCQVQLGGSFDSGLVATRRNAEGRMISLHLLDLRLEGLPIVGSYSPPDGETIESVTRIAPGYDAQIAVSLTDGHVLPLDGLLAPVPPQIEPRLSWSGLRVHTHWAAPDLPGFPVSAQVEGGHELVISRIGGNSLVALEPRVFASIATGAQVRWRVAGGSSALIAEEPQPVVVAVDSASGVSALSLETGMTLWNRGGLFGRAVRRNLHNQPLIAPSTSGNAVWLHRSGDGTYELVRLGLQDGVLLEPPVYLDENNGGWRRLSLLDQEDGALVLSGRVGEIWAFAADGSVVSTLSVGAGPLAMPLGTIDGDRGLLNVQLDAVEALRWPDGQMLWSTELGRGPSNRYGALVQTVDGPRLGMVLPGTDQFRILDASTGSPADQSTLRSGLSTKTAPDNAPPLALGNVTAVEELHPGGPPAFLIGSSDGYLYAVEATSGELIWSLHVDEAIGEVITSDWDGDGTLELAVSTASGSLFGIDTFVGDPPAWVHDLDSLESNEDIDEIETFSTLYAAWEEVPLAQSYSVAVVDSAGNAVRPFVDVGLVTRAALEDLPLQNGERYTIAVRARLEGGYTVDSQSDGVTVFIVEPGAPTGGCCNVSSRSGSATALLVFLGFAVGFRGRRRSR